MHHEGRTGGGGGEEEHGAGDERRKRNTRQEKDRVRGDEYRYWLYESKLKMDMPPNARKRENYLELWAIKGYNIGKGKIGQRCHSERRSSHLSARGVVPRLALNDDFHLTPWVSHGGRAKAIIQLSSRQGRTRDIAWAHRGSCSKTR